MHAVLTHADVPGKKVYGLEFADQPVLAADRVRYVGEPVAIVAAEYPEQAALALRSIVVEYEPLEPVVDMERALEQEPLHPDRPTMGHGYRDDPRPNVVRHLVIRHGDPDAAGDVVVTGTYEVGIQDQAFLGPESGLAVPDGEGGVDIHVATQWLHVDRDQVAPCLGLPPEQVRIHLSGVGGAFGGREDLSMQIHGAMLALHTSRPVKMVYDRAGVVHRPRPPPPGADPLRAPRDPRGTAHVRPDADPARRRRLRVELDGGRVERRLVRGRAVPRRQRAARVDRRLHEQPAVRGDARLRRRADLLRGRGADGPARRRARDRPGRAPAPERARAGRPPADGPGRHRLAADARGDPARRRALAARGGSAAARPAPPPRGAGNTTHGEGVRRGVGFALGFKNICYSEGFDDFCAARVVLRADGSATVHSAAAEVGQGVVGVMLQVARTELGTDDVALAPHTTASVGSAGSASASRMTWMAAGAVREACRAALEERERGDGGEVDVERVYRHPRTTPLDPETGQVTGERAHVALAVAAMRVVVEVDVELGLTRVVWVGTAQDVGKAINPLAVEGQIEGGIAQGLGLALMEELRTKDGLILNASFTDYLLPTTLDMPPVEIDLVEVPEPDAPYGVKGVGEPPTVVSTAAIVSAMRAATGRPLTRVPVRPDDICFPASVPPGD